MRSLMVVMAIVGMLLIGCTTTFGPSAAVDPTPVPLPPGPYIEVSWVTPDTIAASSFADPNGSKVELFDPTGARLGSVPIDDSEVCYVRDVFALTRLPGGRLAFTDQCETVSGTPVRVGHVYEFDPATSQRSELPRTVGIPGSLAWSADEAELVYGVGQSLCETLYRWTSTSDGPLAMTVEIDGQTVWLGENITDVEGACPSSGQARSPAINPTDGTLAAFVQPSGGATGQDRVDLPWSLVVVSADTAKPVLGGVLYGCCLTWTNAGDLLFSGILQGQAGLYLVHRAGTGLELIGSRELESISLSPDGSTVLAVDAGTYPPPADFTHTPVPILSYPLGSGST
jgi:hypothetical protein